MHKDLGQLRYRSEKKKVSLTPGGAIPGGGGAPGTGPGKLGGGAPPGTGGAMSGAEASNAGTAADVGACTGGGMSSGADGGAMYPFVPTSGCSGWRRDKAERLNLDGKDTACTEAPAKSAAKRFEECMSGSGIKYCV